MKLKMDKLFIVLTIFCGILFGIGLEFLYRLFFPALPTRVPVITIYITVFAILVGFVIMIKAFANGSYQKFGKIIALTLVFGILLTGFTALFEFLYELGGDITFNRLSSSYNYVFVIDDSGSMDSNDPDNERYNAVQTIINSMKPTKDFAIYRFADNVKCITPLGSKDSKNFILQKPSDSVGELTNLMTTIDMVVDDIAASSGGKHTKIIVLTDGIPTDIGFLDNGNSTLNKCKSNDVAVSSVGFGYPDEAFLTDLATQTGGIYVFSDNIDNLTQSLDTIIKTIDISTDSTRDLLGSRYIPSILGSVLYGFMRVIFLILIGILWTIVKMMLVGERKYTKKGVVVSIILCSVAAIFCELMFLIIPSFTLLAGIVRVIFCGLWACTLFPKQTYNDPGIDDSLNNHNVSVDTNRANDLMSGSQQGVGGTKSFL